MKRRLRAYDLISAVGVVLLLVWTPIYMAQAPSEREGVGGTEFVLPAPRYGDHIEMEIVVQTSAGPAVTTGGILTFDFRRPVPTDEAPEGTILVEERHFPAKNLDLGSATFVQDERTELRFYGDDGSRIGTHIAHHTYIPTWDHIVPPVGEKGAKVFKQVESSLPYDFGGYRLPMGEERVVYDAKPTWQLLREGIWIDRPEPTKDTDTADPPVAVAPRPLTEDEQAHAPFAARHHDHLLYAKGYFEDWSGYVGNHTRVTLGIRALDLEVEWKEPVRVDAPRERWGWFSPEVPLQAGEHHRFYDTSGAFVYSVDLVPIRIERGGQPVPFTPRNDEGPSKEPEQVADNHDFSHDEPFLDDISLHTIGEWLLAPWAPPEIRTMVADGGRPAGIAWGTDGTTTTILAAVAHKEHLRVAEIGIAGTSGEPKVSDACDRNVTLVEYPIRVACASAAGGEFTVRPGLATHSSPAAVWEIRRALQERTIFGTSEIGSWSAVLSRPLTPEEGHGMHLIDPFVGLPTNMDTALGGYGVTISVANETTRTTASTTSDSTFHFERYRRNDDAKGYGADLQSLSGPRSESPRIIHPLGPEPAYGGLALVALGLLLRLLAALKAGAHLPVAAALYAKISKDEALDHEHREAIHGLVSADPGVTIDEVAKASGLSRTAAFHHLQTLARNGLITVTRIGRMRHFFPPGQLGPRERLRLAVARHDDWDRVLRAVEARPGISLGDLVVELERSKTSVSRIGTHLAQVGLVRKEKTGRAVRYHPVRIAQDDHSPDKSRAPSFSTG